MCEQIKKRNPKHFKSGEEPLFKNEDAYFENHNLKVVKIIDASNHQASTSNRYILYTKEYHLSYQSPMKEYTN